jgi:cyanate lyase
MLCPSTRFGVGLLRSAQSSGRYSQLLHALKLSDSELLRTDRLPIENGFVQTVPTDPLIYRFHEVTQIYGASMKAVIQENLEATAL